MLAAITLEEIGLLLVIITIVHVVLLAPIVLAVVRTWLEYHENQALRRSRSKPGGSTLNG